MTLTQIVDFCEKRYGSRFQVKRTDIIVLLNQLQKLAFNKDFDAFLQWGVYLTVYREIEFSSSGYTSAVVGDIGKTVVGATSGASGTLISYDNSTYTWVVNVTNGLNYSNSEAVTITTGTGAGTLVGVDAELGYMGPYNFPTAIPVRKLLGLTKVTDLQYFTGQSAEGADTDYGLNINVYDKRKEFLPGRTDVFNQTFTFASGPSTEGETYRWVYYRAAPDLTDEEDETTLLIPEQFHFVTLIKGVEVMCNSLVYGEPSDEEALLPYLQPFWDWCMQVRPENGETALGISEGQL